MQVHGWLIELFWRRLVQSHEDRLVWAFKFRYEGPDWHRERVLRDLRRVIESPDFSYVEKAAFYMFDQCSKGEVHAEEAFRWGWKLLTDDPYPEHPAPLQMETMIFENEVDCSALRGLLVCCFNREVNQFRRRGKKVGAFRIGSGAISYLIDNPNYAKHYGKLIHELILDPHHTFVDKAKFFIRDFYQDGEEAARDVFKRILSNISPSEPNPLA